MRRLLPCLAFAVVLALGNTSSAQNFSEDELEKFRPQIQFVNAKDSHFHRKHDMRGHGWALQTLDLDARGDRKLQRISIGANKNRISADLMDSSPRGDRFMVTGGWAFAWTNQVHVAERAKCRKTCTLPIKKQAGMVFALSGFDLNRRGGDDNILEIAVMPNAEQDEVTVTFRDNSGNREFDVRIEYVLIPKERIYGVHGVNLTHNGTRQQVASLGLHSAIVARREARTTIRLDTRDGRRVRTRSSTSADSRSATHVIRGFRAKFTNTDHHFGRLMLDLRDRRATAEFRDRNRDDPSSIELSYALVDVPITLGEGWERLPPK